MAFPGFSVGLRLKGKRQNSISTLVTRTIALSLFFSCQTKKGLKMPKPADLRSPDGLKVGASHELLGNNKGVDNLVIFLLNQECPTLNFSSQSQ